jgi:hypothetical protein
MRSPRYQAVRALLVKEFIANELLERGRDVVGIAPNSGETAPKEHSKVRSGSVYDSALLHDMARGAELIG